MSEMVERVARVLWRQHMLRVSDVELKQYRPLDEDWKFYVADAQELIEEIREPTPEMVATLLKDMRSNELCWDANEEVLRRVINKIIDAALK